MERKYIFYDTFKKSCEFKNGTGECHKTRESKRCIDNKCEIVKIPMKKKEILTDYYSQIKQEGSGENTFECPFCNKSITTSELTQHVKTHKNESCMLSCIYCGNMTGSGERLNVMEHLHKKWWNKNKHFINSKHFPN